MKILHIILGFFGLPYCFLCGSKLRLIGTHGYDQKEDYACTNRNCRLYEEDLIGI